MRNTRRLLSLALVLLMAVTCLSLTAFADEAELPQVELTYWIGGDGEQKDTAMVVAAINEKSLEQLNCTIKWVNLPFGEYYEKWSKALAAQEQIDLCWTGWVHNIQNEVNNGALLPLDDYAEYGVDLFASLSEEAINAHRSADGKLYQFPAWQGLVGGRSYYAFPKYMYDAVAEQYPTWLEDMQAAMYASWDKGAEEKKAVYELMEQYLSVLKEKELLRYGYPATQYDLASWFTGKGKIQVGQYGYVDYYDDTFTVKANADYPASLMNWEYVAKWFKAGYIRADMASLEVIGNEYKDQKNDEDIYVMFGHNALTDNALSKELAGVPYETVNVFTNPSAVYALGVATGTSIPFTSANPERAMMLMNLLVTDEGKDIYNLFSYGIEGTHYAWNEDHTEITVFGGEGQSSSTWDYGQRPWTLGSLLFAYSCKVYPSAYYQDLAAAEKTAYVEPLMGFSFDATSVEIEQANIKAVEEEFGKMLGRGYLGDEWETQYEVYRAKLNAAGLEAYLAEVQRQVTEFVTSRNRTW